METKYGVPLFKKMTVLAVPPQVSVPDEKLPEEEVVLH